MPPKVTIREVEPRKPDLLTALMNLKNSPDFQTLIEQYGKKALKRLDKKLLTDRDPVEIYRSQGGKYEITRFLNVDKTIEELSKELNVQQRNEAGGSEE